MIKIPLFTCTALCFALPEAHAEILLERLDLRDCETGSAARLLGALTGEKVIATDLAKKKTVDILLRNASLEDSLKAISRSAGLVYRFDADSRIYTIMGLDEYQRGSLNEAEGLYETKIFKVAAANLNQIASSLESLFGERVILTDGQPIENFRLDPSGGGSSATGTGTQTETGFGGNGQQTSFNSNNTTGNDGSNSSNRSGRGASSTRSSGGFDGPGGVLPQKNSFSNESALTLESARSEAEGETSAIARGGAVERERRVRADTQNIIYVTTNPEHSLLVVRTADRAASKEITALVTNLDRPVPQVILEMKILQLDVGDGLKAGVSWDLSKGNEKFNTDKRDSLTGKPTAISYLGREQNLGLGRFASDSAATFAYEYISDELRARVNLLASDNRVEVIATPVLIATNNRSAQIQVGEQRIVTVGASTDTVVAGESGTRNNLVTVETEKRTIGTTLRIIPRINDDRTVTLFVNQESTTLKPKNNTIQVGSEIIPIDSVDSANIDATVVGKDGNTVAIGGLIRDEVSDQNDKIPFLGDIPYLGNAFKRKGKSARKTELILLITPHILDSSGRANAVTQELTQRLSDHRYRQDGDGALDSENATLRRLKDQPPLDSNPISPIPYRPEKSGDVPRTPAAGVNKKQRKLGPTHRR